MCGVAGIFSYSNVSPLVDREELRAIRDHMRARGPDGRGEWYSVDHRVGLGHRRLSIIDLSERGAQPIVSQDGKLVVSFNGEIYNYRQLRNDLEAKGRVFRSDSDTEVLLHLYDEKGEAMLQELRGMFAFALWDARKNALLLARDPYGIKPLFYADDGGTLRFASQVKAILAGGKVSRQVEPAGLAGYYLFGSVPEPWTLYREISAVPAGGYLWAGKTGLSKPVNYFSIAGVWAEAEGAAVEADPQEQVQEALLDSVRHHLVADVPVGAFLSSGIDSGTLVGLMAEVKNRELISSGHKGRREAENDSIQTITLAFEEFRGRHDDESPLAAKIAERYGARHVTRYVTEGEFRQDLPKILEAMDQPTIDGINTWFVAKAAKEQGLKVAVSGVGGDELFGGYPSFRDIPKWVGRLKIPGSVPGLGAATESILSAILPLFPAINPKAAGMFRYGGSYAGAYMLRRCLFLPRELPQLMGPEMAREGLERLRPIDRIEQAMDWGKGNLNTYQRISILESALYMRNQLLRDTDWASMAHSIETRLPLVDVKLLQNYASFLAGNYASVHGVDYKSLLAFSPAISLPNEIIKRAKSGFITPVGKWQQQDDNIKVWRHKPLMSELGCPWARRWGCTVINHKNGRFLLEN